MHRDYGLWTKVKKVLNCLPKRPEFKERKIWWCSVGENIGDEEDGKGKDYTRPVLIIRKFNKHICFALPMTTKIKNNVYYYRIEFKNRTQCLMLSQMRLIDSKRLQLLMGKISHDEFWKIREAIGRIIFKLKINSAPNQGSRP